MMSQEEIDKDADMLQNYICAVKRKIMEIDNKYDDVNKLIEYNVIKNRILRVAMTTCDLLESLTARLRETKNFAAEIRKIVDNINDKIEMLKD